MSRPKKPSTASRTSRPAASGSRRPAPARPAPASARPAPAHPTERLARGVFVQLLEQKVAPEAIVDGLSDAGLEEEAIGELLTAVRACITFVDALPDDAEELETDDLADFLVAEKDIDAEVALDVVEAFFSLGEEA